MPIATNRHQRSFTMPHFSPLIAGKAWPYNNPFASFGLSCAFCF
jgi:hypothetical protein